MKLDQQVVSLELAKRLKELGVKQESLFWWGDTLAEPRWQVLIPEKMPRGEAYESARRSARYAAFTCAELSAFLPPTLRYKGRRLEYVSMQDVENWQVGYQTTNGKWASFIDTEGNFFWWAKTEADARAKMLVHLIEYKLINVPR